MNWNKMPFVKYLIPLIIGILTGIYTNWHLPIFIPLICFGLTLVPRFSDNFIYQPLVGLFAYLFLFTFGIWNTYQFNQLNDKQHFSQYLSNKNEVAVAEIIAPPTINKWIKCQVKINGIGQEQAKNTIGKAVIYLAPDSTIAQLYYGDLILLSGTFQEIAPPSNPKQFDYKRYLKFKNIHHQTFVKSGNWKVLSRKKKNGFHAAIAQYRTHLLGVLKTHLHTEREFAVGAALILGYKDAITDDVQTAYADTGAMHVLAVSGLHVGIIAFVLKLFLGLIRSKNRFWSIAKPVINILGIWFFALLAGGSPSVLRASCMFTLVIIGFYINRRSFIYNTLAASAFLMLLYNPYFIMEVGFQLSYAAVFGIVLLQPSIVKRLYIPPHQIQTKGKSLLNIIGQLTPKKIGLLLLHYLWALLAVSIAAQLSTLPITLYYFQQFPTMFWLSGLLVIPAAAFIMILGILSFISYIRVFFGKLLFWLIWSVNECIFGLQNLPLGVIKGISLSFVFAIIAYLLFLFLAKAFLNRRKNPVKALIISCILILGLMTLYAYRQVKTTQQRKIIAYNIYKNTLIDFVDGQKITSIQSDSITEKHLEFNVKSNRYALEVATKNIQHHFLGDSTQSAHFWSDGLFFQFYDKKLLIIHQPIHLKTDSKIEIDYLFISQNPKLSLEEIVPYIDFKTIIFDGSNGRWKLEKWITYCKENKIDYWNMAEKGYWSMDF